MTTITVNVPDEIAARLQEMERDLPALLSLALALHDDRHKTEMPANWHPAFGEVLDFLATGPTPAELVAYKVSPQTQLRLETLLAKNQEDGLTAVETAELDTYQQINHLFILLKARARQTLSATN
jgi:hypothetical protein